MTILSKEAGEAAAPYFWRGIRAVRSNFPGTTMFLAQNGNGELIGEMRVPDHLATPEFEQMLLDWLERVDPVEHGRPGPALVG